MAQSDIRTALEPASEVSRPFAADTRQRPRFGGPPLVTQMEIPYRQWDGPKLPWAEDFGKGKGQVYSRDATDPIRSCNEVEVAKRLRRVRQNAYWVSCYSPGQIPSIWRPWAIAPDEAPQWLQSLDSKIRRVTGVRNGGIPDVVAWNDSDPLSTAIFVECKGRKESFKEGQEDWVKEALTQGVRLEQFAVAVRPFP